MGDQRYPLPRLMRRHQVLPADPGGGAWMVLWISPHAQTGVTPATAPIHHGGTACSFPILASGNYGSIFHHCNFAILRMFYKWGHVDATFETGFSQGTSRCAVWQHLLLSIAEDDSMGWVDPSLFSHSATEEHQVFPPSGQYK